MQLYLQFGHGMIEHTKALLKDWGEGGVILSPRDLTRDQLVNLGSAIAKMGRDVLLDPQCFAHDCDHHRLSAHEHFKAFKKNTTGALFTSAGAAEMIKPLCDLGTTVGVSHHIVPGVLAAPVSDEWIKLQRQFIDACGNSAGGLPLLATIALSSDSVRSDEQIEAVVEAAAKWPVEGFYVVAESPNQYLVEDPVWVANVLILVSGLKLHGKRVVVGYSNHQMLVLAAANADVMASGTWLNVRSFPISRFYQAPDDEQSRRTTWYYCAQSLSEYKLPFLDLAKRQGVLDSMRPDQQMNSSYADPLFAGPDPSTVNWREPDAFRHYLTCLRSQCSQATTTSFDDACARHASLLDSAAKLVQKLASKGVRGDYRDFGSCFDTNQGAIALLERARGHRLREEWM